jgi:hypothetical protein
VRARPSGESELLYLLQPGTVRRIRTRATLVAYASGVDLSMGPSHGFRATQKAVSPANRLIRRNGSSAQHRAVSKRFTKG